MFEFFYFMIAFNIHRQIHSEIVRYTVSISIRVINAFTTAEIIDGCGQRDGPARTVIDIDRNTEAVIQLIIPYKL